MKKLLLLLLCVPLIGLGQHHACGFNEDISVTKSCRSSSSQPSKEINKIISDIRYIVGTSFVSGEWNFKFIECDFTAAAAWIQGHTRVISYSSNYLQSSNINKTQFIAILCHEIAHHVLNHLFSEERNYSDSHLKELEADEMAGFLMNKLGYSLSESVSVYNLMSHPEDDTYSTHPAKYKRVNAFTKGYKNYSISQNWCEDIVWYGTNYEQNNLVVKIRKGKSQRSGELSNVDLWEAMVTNKDYFKEYFCHNDCAGFGYTKMSKGPSSCFLKEFEYTWNRKKLYNFLKYEPTNGSYRKFTNMSFSEFNEKFFGPNKDEYGKLLAELIKKHHENPYQNNYVRKGEHFITTVYGECPSWCPYYHKNRTSSPQSVGYFESLE